jgi:hypothetical protein
MSTGSQQYVFSRGEDPLRADKLNGAIAERVLVNGDTMLGSLFAWRDPQLPLEVATKRWVDQTAANIRAAAVSIVPLQQITPDDSTTTFDLISAITGTAATPASANDIQVYINGLYQKPVTDYGVNPNKIVFTVAPTADSIVTMFWWSLSGGAGTGFLPLTGGTISGSLAVTGPFNVYDTTNLVNLTQSGYTTINGANSGGAALLVQGGDLSVGNNHAITTGGTMLCGHLAAGRAGVSPGGFIGSWDVTRQGADTYTGFYTDNGGNIVFCSADAGQGSVSGSRATLSPSGLLTVASTLSAQDVISRTSILANTTMHVKGQADFDARVNVHAALFVDTTGVFGGDVATAGGFSATAILINRGPAQFNMQDGSVFTINGASTTSGNASISGALTVTQGCTLNGLLTLNFNLYAPWLPVAADNAAAIAAGLSNGYIYVNASTNALTRVV